MVLTLLTLVIVTAIIFEYINGFHDSANAIATVVSTKVLTARAAIVYAGVLNIAGAFMGTHVASTIGKGIVATDSVTQGVILCALLSAIIWNLITWYYGIPSSSSHALIGGLLGAAISKAGYHVVQYKGVLDKVLLPMVTSPLIGFVIGFLCMVTILWVCAKANPNTGLQTVAATETGRYGIVATSDEHGRIATVTRIVEKPKPADAPSNLAVVGRYLLSPTIFDLLERVGRAAGGEIQLTEGIAGLLATEKVYAYRFDGKRYDCGSKLGYLEATVEFGLKHAELGGSFARYLRRLAASLDA